MIAIQTVPSFPRKPIGSAKKNKQIEQNKINPAGFFSL